MKRMIICALLATSACTTLEQPAEARRVKPAAPSFSITCGTVAEEIGNANCTITKTGDNRKSSIVSYRTIEGSAEDTSDYTAVSGTVTFRSYETKRSVSVPILNDSAPEEAEQLAMRIDGASNARIGTAQDNIDITDTDVGTQQCWDGSVISISLTCPDEPEEEPQPDENDDIETPSTAGAAYIDGGFDETTAFRTLPNLPGISGDEYSAFRFACGAGQLLYDDPIVYPGQAGEGASHLHQFFGNMLADGDSTYESLRTAGGSTCNDYGAAGSRTTAANRSAYWMPAMLDGKGHVVLPEGVTIYYKQPPSSSKRCGHPSANADTWGICVPIPNGLRFIFGYDMLTGTPPTGGTYFNCTGPGAIPDEYPSLPAVKAANACPVGAKLLAIIRAPECWDGVRLDSANHRDHVAYRNNAAKKCPTTHPYLIPKFTMTTGYDLEAGDDLALFKLSSDDHARMTNPTLPNGGSYHADYFEAWGEIAKAMWMDGCINKHLTCTSGDMGNFKQLIGAYAGRYDINGTLTYSFDNPDHLVDIPVDPTP